MMRSPDLNELNNMLSSAKQYLAHGNVPQAEIICRHSIDVHGTNPGAYALLAAIASNYHLYDYAVDYLTEVTRLVPNDKPAKQNLRRARDRLKNKHRLQRGTASKSAGQSQQNRYLVIKAWGYGFWSDVDHVVAQLLLAEITDRIPVIHWGDNYLFREPDSDNAYDLYFKPVSEYSIHDLLGKSFSIYPDKWQEINLLKNDVNKWHGKHARMAALYLLGSEENVVVSDFYTSVHSIMNWIRPQHALYELGIQELYRYLFSKYIKLKPEVLARVDEYWSRISDRRPLLAVHVRSSDKELEAPSVKQINTQYNAEIDNWLVRDPDLTIFLLTDSTHVIDEYVSRYGDRLISRDCNRTDNDIGIHHQKTASKHELALDVIIDTYTAARCDYFVGNGHSNVSTTVLHLKEWTADTHTLLGKNTLFETNFWLHTAQ